MLYNTLIECCDEYKLIQLYQKSTEWCFAFTRTSTFELIPSVAKALPGAWWQLTVRSRSPISHEHTVRWNWQSRHDPVHILAPTGALGIHGDNRSATAHHLASMPKVKGSGMSQRTSAVYAIWWYGNDNDDEYDKRNIRRHLYEYHIMYTYNTRSLIHITAQ